MDSLARIVLAASLLLAGMPHLGCGCGCGETAAELTASPAVGCPHCRAGVAEESAAPAGDPAPCRCGTCELRVAWLPTAATPPAEARSHGPLISNAPFSDVASSVAATVSHRLPAVRNGGAPPGRSIPILLGHLLF